MSWPGFIGRSVLMGAAVVGASFLARGHLWALILGGLVLGVCGLCIDADIKRR